MGHVAEADQCSQGVGGDVLRQVTPLVGGVVVEVGSLPCGGAGVCDKVVGRAEEVLEVEPGDRQVLAEHNIDIVKITNEAVDGVSCAHVSNISLC